MEQPDFLVFLGSGGARIVVAKQVRASGGIWFCLNGTQFLVDPGPGALVRITSSRHRLDPTQLAGILVSHRHLDHSADVNVMIEAMTMGGTQRRGILFAPSDALEGDDPVVLRYLRQFLESVVTLRAGGEFCLGGITFTCPVRHQHRGEVYGFRFQIPGLAVSYIADTRFFPELAQAYQADVVIFNTVRARPSDLDHLHVPEVEELVRVMRPRLSVITHFGMTMLRAKPWLIAREMSERTGCEVIAASDGRRILLSQFRSAS
ncbi:MAG: MBL fold metallo-hydrolase [candidate division WOR-3 bacterium]